MFNLGNKEIILNSSTNIAISHDTVNKILNVKGYGSFHEDQLVSAIVQRYTDSRCESLAITAPSAATLGVTTVGVPVTFGIRINTFRETSEYAIDYIKKSRPLIFEIFVSVGDDSAAVGAKMINAFAAWNQNFNYTDEGLPFTYLQDASNNVIITAKHYTIAFKYTIEFKVDKAVTFVTATTTNFADSGSTIYSFELTDSGAAVATTSGTADTFDVDVVGTLQIGDIIVLAAGKREITDITLTTIEVDSAIAFVQNETVYIQAATDTTNTITVDAINDLRVGDTIKIASGEVKITEIVGTELTLAASVDVAMDEVIYLKAQSIDPTFSGKYLEENVRMSLPSTSDSYSIARNEKPNVNGKYASIVLTLDDDTVGGIANTAVKHSFLGNTRGERGGKRLFKFTMYFEEDSDLFTTGAGHHVFDVVDFIDNSPITASVTRLLGNGEIAADAAAFVA